MDGLNTSAGVRSDTLTMYTMGSSQMRATTDSRVTTRRGFARSHSRRPGRTRRGAGCARAGAGAACGPPASTRTGRPGRDSPRRGGPGSAGPGHLPAHRPVTVSRAPNTPICMTVAPNAMSRVITDRAEA